MKDRELLRELARQVSEAAHSQRMRRLKEEWKLHNALQGVRPMICASPEGAWCEILPPEALQCQDPLLRDFERTLRMKLFWANEIKDDTPVSEYFNVPYVTSLTSYGDGLKETRTDGENRGSFHYKKLINDIDAEFDRLRFRRVLWDEQESKRRLETAGDLFGDILKVRHRGAFWWTLGITSEVIKLIGLEDLMMDMYDNPDGLHRLMKWFSEEHLSLVRQYRDMRLLTLNNEDDLIASGGIGYTDQLPGDAYAGKTDFMDLWGFSESQETVGISPQMFAEFIFPYQLPLLELFGINCYGCCEPVEGRWEWIQKIPRLRRISVSPWSKKELMRDLLGKHYIFSRKPNPSFVCMGFDEDAIRVELDSTFALSKDTHIEIILKDTHTVENDISRFGRWVELARRSAQKY